MDAEAKARATAAGASPRSSAMSTMDEEADGAIAASAAALRASRCEECKLGAVECLICGDCGCVDGGCCRAWAKTPFCAFAADAVDGLGWKLRALATADATSAVFRSRAVSDAANGGVRDADLPVFDAGLRRAVMGAHDSVLSDRRRRLSGEESGAQPRAAPGMAPLDMMQCLAVCHTVVPAVVESAPGAKQSVIRYEAESPDEGALVNAAAAYGWRLTQRTHSEITVAVRTDRQDRSSFTIAQLEAKGSAPGHERRSSTVEAEEVWQVLALNKFSSARKCMSMLTRRPADGKAVLWVKGADSVMLAKSLDVREGDDAAEAGGGAHGEHVRAWLAQELDRFARAGLRTLILGKRELEEDEVKAWLCEYDAAMNADDRDSALAEAAVSIERGVELVGATGIEDKLQEGVPGTIADLAVAGIKLWVLTGDKMETAINIGQTCNLLREGMDVIELRGGESAGVSARVAELYRTHVIESDRSDAEREKSLLDRIASVPLTGLADVDALRKCCRPHVNRFIGWSSCCRQNAATSDGATRKFCLPPPPLPSPPLPCLFSMIMIILAPVRTGLDPRFIVWIQFLELPYEGSICLLHHHLHRLHHLHAHRDSLPHVRPPPGPSVDPSFVTRWQLACEEDIAHVVVMPNVTRDKVDVFVTDLLKSVEMHGRFAQVREDSPLSLLSDPAWSAAERRRRFDAK